MEIRNIKGRLIIFFICLIGFVIVTTLVITGRMEAFDDAIRYFCYDLRRP